MKFGKEFTAHMVPEWHEAYMDYNKLKGVLKGIHRFNQQRSPPSLAASSAAGLKRKLTMYRAFSGLTRRYSNLKSPSQPDMEDQVILVNAVGRSDGEEMEEEGGGEHQYKTRFLMSSDEGGEYELVFFKRLDDEFNKVNGFYGGKVEEVMKEAATLNKQMDALIVFHIKVENPMDGHIPFPPIITQPASVTPPWPPCSASSVSGEGFQISGEGSHGVQPSTRHLPVKKTGCSGGETDPVFFNLLLLIL